MLSASRVWKPCHCIAIHSSIILTYYLNRVAGMSLFSIQSITLNWLTWDWTVMHIRSSVGVRDRRPWCNWHTIHFYDRVIVVGSWGQCVRCKLKSSERGQNRTVSIQLSSSVNVWNDHKSAASRLLSSILSFTSFTSCALHCVLYLYSYASDK